MKAPFRVERGAPMAQGGRRWVYTIPAESAGTDSRGVTRHLPPGRPQGEDPTVGFSSKSRADDAVEDPDAEQLGWTQNHEMSVPRPTNVDSSCRSSHSSWVQTSLTNGIRALRHTGSLLLSTGRA